MLYLSNILSTPRPALFILIINMIDGSHFLCITQVCFCKSNTSKYHLHYAHNFLFTKGKFQQQTWPLGFLEHRRDGRLEVLRDLNFSKT